MRPSRTSAPKLARCILQATRCEPPRGVDDQGEYVLLLSSTGALNLGLTRHAKNWLKIRLFRADLRVREIPLSDGNPPICQFCTSIDNAIAVIADVTFRDPLVYLGLALAHERNKLVRFLAHHQVDVADRFENVISYPDGPDLPSSFERDVDSLIRDIQEGPPPPSLALLNVKFFCRVLSKLPGERTDKEVNQLAKEWSEKLLSRCCQLRPEIATYRNLISGWYKQASYSDHLLRIPVPKQHLGEAKPLLAGPAFRHSMETAIFELTNSQCNWLVRLDDVVKFDVDSS